MDSNNHGQCYVFTFPFWLFIEKPSTLEISEITIEGNLIRIYPPFRSEAANYTPLPIVNYNEMPFMPGVRPNMSAPLPLQPIGLYPDLKFDSEGKTGITIAPTEKWDPKPDPFPMDSLRIDIIGKDANNGNFAEIMASNFLRILREESFQWWISYSIHPLIGLLRSTFSINSQGGPKEIPYSNGKIRTSAKYVKPVTQQSWNTAITKLEQGYNPLLSLELFLDGLYFLNTEDFRRATIEFAISCEFAKDQAIKRLWERKNPGKSFKRGKVLKGNSLPVHLSQDLLEKFGFSYKFDYPKNFEIISDLWEARGNVAHGGKLKFVSKGRAYIVDETIGKSFSEAALHCIEWLNNL